MQVRFVRGKAVDGNNEEYEEGGQYGESFGGSCLLWVLT
jgi:hypothetical protein